MSEDAEARAWLTLSIHVNMQRKKKVKVPVMVVTAGFRTGMLDTRCDIITVMEDDTCQCGCHVTSDTCNNKFHVFNPHAFQCQCSNFHVAKNCSGPLHVWDSRACACACRRDTWKLCPTGYLFESVKSCDCVPVHYKASISIVIVILIISVGIISLVSYIMICRRSFQMRRRRESLARVLEEDSDEELH